MAGRTGELEWEREGLLWPQRVHSRFVSAGGMRWHVQRFGRGPVVLLVHGTGASTHTWGGVAPLLAKHFTVVAMDLPGHGFTAAPARAVLSLPGMAQAVAALTRELEVEPRLMVGHSAGAAILCRMCLEGLGRPAGVVSLNGALLPLRGLPGQIFGPAARALAGMRLIPAAFSRYARDPAVAERLIRQTGSAPESRSLACYQALLRSPDHVGAALRMMANWDLGPLTGDLPRLSPALHLVACSNDRTVSPSEARWLRGRLSRATLEMVPDLGHLGHEERPHLFADLILRVAKRLGVELPARL